MNAEDPWGGLNPLGCCRDHRTEGGVLVHGGADCRWPGSTQLRGKPSITMTSFLLARIAEDEENASRYVDTFPDGDSAPLFRRVLAECAAKRAIIDLADEAGGMDSTLVDEDYSFHDIEDQFLRALAAVYADHPDYRQGWKARA